MNSTKLSAWFAGLLVMAVAGCSSDADTAAVTQPSEPARVWQGVAAGCPELVSPPYGIDAKGKRSTRHVAPGEQKVLDRVVPGAQFEDTVCQYSELSFIEPNIDADLRVFRGETSAAQAKALFETEQAAASRLGVDYAGVPGVGDGAFAYYFEPQMHLVARSGNAYVVVSMTPAATGLDKVRPLQPLVPVLTAVMTNMLTTLQ